MLRKVGDGAGPSKRTNGWSSERRAAQAAAIERWRPWERSTGPRSEAGKQRSRLNATKHGNRSADSLALHRKIGAVLKKWRAARNQGELIGLDGRMVPRRGYR